MTPRRHRKRGERIAPTDPSRYLDQQVVVLQSARKHGLADEEIEHAWRNAQWTTGEQDDGMVMIVGPASNGNPLEVGAVEARDMPGLLLIVHAMPARARFLN